MLQVHVEETKKKNDLNHDVAFGDQPVGCVCPHCKHSVVTQVDHKATWITWIVAIAVILFFSWVSVCILPFIWPLFQDAFHYCPHCLNLIKQKGRISLPSIRQEIVSLRCGSCAVVLSRKYVIMLGMLTFLVFVAYGLRYYFKFVGLPDIPKGEVTNKTWDDFIYHCGVRSYLGNPIHAVAAFEEQFSQKTVTWEGRVKRVQEGFWSKNFMFINMVPPQLSRQDLADLALIFDQALNEKVAKVHVGDIIRFETTLLSFGRRGQPHFGMLWDFNVTATYDSLPPPHVVFPSLITILRDGNTVSISDMFKSSNVKE